MKKTLCLFVFIAVCLLTGCGKDETGITHLSMLEGGKTFAVPTGTVADQFVYRRFPDAKIEYYNSALDCALAVQREKADAAVYDKPILKNIAAKNEGIVVLPELLEVDNYGFAVQLDNIPLKTAIDETLAELKSNRGYDDMLKRWFPVKGAPAPMPAIDLSGSNGILRFGTAAVTEPMSFHDAHRNIVGFDVEFAIRVAFKLNKKIEITDMEFGALLPALISGKVDMIGAGLSITEERAKKVLFSESYYPSGIAALVRGDAPAPVSIAGRKMKTVDDIRDKTIGVMLGSVYDTYVMGTYPDARVLQYQSISDLLMALKSGKIDVTYFDQVSVPEMLKLNTDLDILAKDIFSIPIAAGFNRDNDALREQFNAFLREIRSNGVYQDMVARWMEEGNMDMPEIEGAKTEGVLRAGVVNDMGMPFGLVRDGRLIGFDIELSSRFAAYTGREYVPVPLQFGSLISSISTNKIDIITASMSITEERSRMIDFSDPYFESGVSLIARKDALDPSVAGAAEDRTSRTPFLERVSDSFYSNIILEKRYQLILDGLQVTIVISIFSALLGTLLGGLICFMRMSNLKILSMTAGLYISLLRGTPVLVLLMIIYYIVFSSIHINPVLVSIIAFALNFGAYVSEMFRTSIQSIDTGQKEAGIAGGFTNTQTFIHIIAPQALRHLLPVYKGEFISLVKMTSIVGYIAVQDLTKASDIIRSRTFDAFFPLIMAAVIYLVITWLLTKALGCIEISVAPKRKHMIKEVQAG
ncbi:MAG: ABC transporter permease subunit [Deltaproteobacteria bacterium]|nr:ABC transporter permease subunit [Deltaproteobacteria bacterium]